MEGKADGLTKKKIRPNDTLENTSDSETKYS